MKKIIYQAIFLDEESVRKVIEMQKEKLPKTISNIHCTFKYAPSTKEIEIFSKILLGKYVTLQVIGYCSNGINSGFEVSLGPELEKIYTNSHTIYKNGISKVEKTTPHITVSMNKDADAINTGFLNFVPLEKCFEISGTGGFFVADKEKGKSSIVYEQISLEENINIENINHISNKDNFSL